MAKGYHGPLPVTQADVSMAKTHLKDTLNFKKAELNMNLQKIADHRQAANSTPDPVSKSYNQGHIEGHVKDNKVIQKTIDDRQTSMKTISKLKGASMASPVNKTGTTQKTGSYKGQSNALGGGGRFKQMTDSGMSPGLAAFIGRKKFGAGNMAKMAAKGK